MENEPRMVFDPFKNLGVLVSGILSMITCTVFFLATLASMTLRKRMNS